MLRDVEVYSPDTDSWHATPPMAAPRTSLAAAALGGRLYAVGGQVCVHVCMCACVYAAPTPHLHTN